MYTKSHALCCIWSSLWNKQNIAKNWKTLKNIYTIDGTLDYPKEFHAKMIAKMKHVKFQIDCGRINKYSTGSLYQQAWSYTYYKNTDHKEQNRNK